MQLLLDGLSEQLDDPPEVEEPAHRLRHVLDRPLHVHALPEEQAVHQALRPEVQRVQQHHDQHRHHGGGHDGRLRGLPVRQEDVGGGDGARVGQHDEPGGRGVDGAGTERGADVEQVVADQGVGHDDGKQERQLPHRVQVGHRDMEDGLGHGPEDRRNVTEDERGAEDPGSLPDQGGAADHAGPGERKHEKDQRHTPVRGSHGGHGEQPADVSAYERKLEQQHGHDRRDDIGQPDHPREAPDDAAALRKGQREVKQRRRPEGPRCQEQRGEPVRRVRVGERDADDGGDQQEGQEQPALGPPGADQEHDGADRQLEHAGQEALDEVPHEVTARDEPRRDVRLDQLAAPVDDVVERRPGILALDRRLDVPAALEHLPVHDPDDVERLERPPLGAADRDQQVLHDPEPREDPALALVSVEGGGDADGERETEDAPEERVPAHLRYCTPGRAGAPGAADRAGRVSERRARPRGPGAPAPGGCGDGASRGSTAGR